jgi:hypothetical protein
MAETAQKEHSDDRRWARLDVWPEADSVTGPDGVRKANFAYLLIVPVNPAARTLAYLEAVFGQFYIAIIVAALVSSHIATRQREEGEG